LSKPLVGELSGCRSARSGDYRALIRLDDADEMIWILAIDHRAHAYRAR